MTTIQTVLGEIHSDSLGVTLAHEHVFNYITDLWERPRAATRVALALEPVQPKNLNILRNDPFMCRDNLQITDIDDAVAELNQVVALGGHTIIDPTLRDIGRDPLALADVARRTGLNIVMGCGYYLEASHSADFPDRKLEDITEEIVREVRFGVEETGIRAGIIGEIGVGPDMTDSEIKSLRAASRAQVQVGVPITIHTHGWGRDHHRILDIVAEEGVDLKCVILDHMNPNCHEPEYQAGLAERGAYIEYDMLGMDLYYPHIQGQSPSDQEAAEGVLRLIQNGYANRILLSQDVFLKMMLTKYGGNGYAHVLRHFLPRLRRLGVQESQISDMLVNNPRQLFEYAARSNVTAA